jgi:arylsulfatase A-like enzyme
MSDAIDPQQNHPEGSLAPGEGTSRRSFLSRGVALGAALLGAPTGLDALTPAGAAARATKRRAPSHRRPNILVIIVDQMRYPRWFGAAAPQIGLTPNLARLHGTGVSFSRHYTAGNDCTPARSALLTGLHTHQTGCMITGVSTLSPAFETWGRLLRDIDYRTYYFGKWHLTKGDRRWNEIDGPPELEAYGFSGGTYPSPNGAPAQGWHADPMIAEQFVNWYSAQGASEPWCTTVSFVNPHDIAWWYRWTELSRHETSAPRVIKDLPPNFETPDQLLARNKPAVQRSLLQTTDLSFGDVPYSGSDLRSAWLPFLDLYVKLQLAVDLQIGRVLDTLANHPSAASNTIVIFTSDHGEYGASHGLRGKGAGLYEECINVPLIVNDFRGKATRAPGITRNQISSSVDVVPMMLTLATGSNSWRKDSAYAHLESRADLTALLANPHGDSGRQYALHATDEILTEFALEPYSAAAPLHIVGLMTENAKYGVYSHWRPHTIEALTSGQNLELYDYSTPAGRLEIDNVAGHSHLQEGLAAQMSSVLADELHAALPRRLARAQRDGFADYFASAHEAASNTAARRRRELEQIVSTDLGGALAGKPGKRRHKRR